LNYSNDDDGLRRLGSDSRIHFAAPYDGTFLARVADVRGRTGERFAYRLIVRRAKPDFHVALGFEVDPKPSPGAGVQFNITVERIDGFDGPVTVEVTGLPPGFVASSPVLIEAGHSMAQGTIFALPDAPAPENATPARVTATAEVEGTRVVKDVEGLGSVALGAEPKVRVWLEPYQEGQESAPEPLPYDVTPEIAVIPGRLVPAWLRIERKGFNDPVTFEVESLPHGVIVADIGLNGVLIPEDQTERKIFLQCSPWVATQSRLCHARANEAEKPTSRPVRVRVASR
jgi:hypothetical protein